MGQIKSFQELEVWKTAHQLALAVYRLTNAFPPDEKHGLVSQMRRAAVSIPANIAEGFKRPGKAENIRFYSVSESSLEELKVYFILSKDLGYVAETDQLMTDAETASRMLFRLIASIDSNDDPACPPVCRLLSTIYLR